MKHSSFENRIVKNRKSPKNEDEFINAYKELNPRAIKKDNYDIAAVTAKNGEKGHGLMNQSINRSKDRNNHMAYDFILDSELKKEMKK